jgi:tetratricopeptide (TPR) repeat protein
MERGDYAEALDHLQQARTYPENLGEGKLIGARENRILYYIGLAYQKMGQADHATAAFMAAATGDYEPSSPMYYNDQPPDMIFYQGLALRKLGNGDEADAIFTRLVDYGQTHQDDDVQMDYFAVSLPDFLVFDVDLKQRHLIHCQYMMALGYTGLGEAEQANALYDNILAQEPYHLGAFLHRSIPTSELV